MASWAAASINAGRMVTARNDGLVLRISASASSVSPLMRPKMGVKLPGLCVVPSPETYTKSNGFSAVPRV